MNPRQDRQLLEKCPYRSVLDKVIMTFVKVVILEECLITVHIPRCADMRSSSSSPALSRFDTSNYLLILPAFTQPTHRS
jgi:hypothetical protein